MSVLARIEANEFYTQPPAKIKFEIDEKLSNAQLIEKSKEHSRQKEAALQTYKQAHDANILKLRRALEQECGIENNAKADLLWHLVLADNYMSGLLGVAKEYIKYSQLLRRNNE